KVRVEKERILCYVNDELAITSTDSELSSGQVGLAKFRDTRAQFKGFQLAKEITSSGVSPELVKRVTKSVADLAPDGTPGRELVEKLAGDGPGSLTVLRERAKLLERQAAQLRELALAVHEQRVNNALAKLLQGKDEDIDLIHAALLIAWLDND